MALGLAVAAAASETAIRLFVPESMWKYWDATSDLQPDVRLGWVQKAKLDVTTRFGTAPEPLRFQTNPDGLTPATATRERDPQLLRIMLFGDSSVVGRRMPAGRTIHADLARLLASRGIGADVINAAVQGYSTDQILLRMRQLVPIYRPDTIAYGLNINDLGGIVAREAYGGIGKPVFVLRPDGSLQEIPPDPHRNAIRTLARGAIGWVQYSATYRLLQPSLFVVRSRFMRWEQRNMLGLAPQVYYRPAEMEKFSWNLFAALLKAMEALARENDARFLLYAPPWPEEVWQPVIDDTERRERLTPGQYDRHALERRLARASNVNSITFCPLVDYFLANQSRGPFHLLPGDPHQNAVGHQMTAEGLADCLAKAGFLSAIDRKSRPLMSGR